MRTRTVIAAAIAALALAGCGDDPERRVDADEIRKVVREFAAAEGPEACELLSPNAVVNVYGGFSEPLRKSRAECVRRSENFEGERIHLGEIEVVNDASVRISAKNSDRTVSYNVKVERFGGDWLIEKINQSRISE